MHCTFKLVSVVIKLNDISTGLIFEKEELTIADCFNYLGSCVTKNDNKAVEMSTCISKVLLAYVGVKHFWLRHDTLLKLKGVMCHSALSSFARSREIVFAYRICSSIRGFRTPMSTEE